MEIKQKITPINFTKGNKRKIEYIVIHYFGGLSSAEAVANYFYSNPTSASAHYAVDENSIFQIVKDEDIAWHCGDSTQGVFGGKATNLNTIGIEMRPYKLNTYSQFAIDRDWYFNDQVIKQTQELTRFLMDKYDIPIDRVIRHYDVSKKYCPRPFVGDDINTYYNTSGNDQWIKFKNGLKEVNMDKETIKALIKEVILEMRSDSFVNQYSSEARKWGVDNQIMVGGAYQGLLTREEGIALMHRLYLLLQSETK